MVDYTLWLDGNDQEGNKKALAFLHSKRFRFTIGEGRRPKVLVDIYGPILEERRVDHRSQYHRLYGVMGEDEIEIYVKTIIGRNRAASAAFTDLLQRRRWEE